MKCMVFITLRAHAQSRVKQSVLSVCHPYLSSEEIEIVPHRPSKTFEMDLNNSKYVAKNGSMHT